MAQAYFSGGSRRSREGAWIEIWHLGQKFDNLPVAPVRERGLKYLLKISKMFMKFVAPVRERGLKYNSLQDYIHRYLVAPVRERGLKSSSSPALR